MRYALLLSVLALGACVASPVNQAVESEQEEILDSVVLTAQSFENLPAWKLDGLDHFSTAYDKSCNTLLKRSAGSNFFKDPRFGTNQDWQNLCRQYNEIDKTNTVVVRAFFEKNFIPHLVSNNNNPQGLFTGYYEASLNGSRVRQGPYQTPLRARPSDLVMVQLGDFREELKGQRIAGRVTNGSLKPYETHEEIINGQLPNDMDEALVWVDDPVDAFFLQIQGSGVVSLDGGDVMRVGYAGQNGHPYYAIGRELITRGYLTKDTVSMQSIRDWLAANHTQAVDIMTTNKSYVFFRELKTGGPVGGSGLVLTPERSLAIDRSLMPYHAPIWVNLESPNDPEQTINRLMVSQDTGGAIRGPVRGDFFWGYGSKAEVMAGSMKSQGNYWILMPKSL